ncbi:MAG TPA: NUDIX hydrolase [Anaerolineales bacterium]|nr:NUDIX hydrolase [Anaerolineales bacterium]
MKQHYCLECGTLMQTRQIEAMAREQCPQCGWIYYRHLKVGAVALIENAAGEVLLGVRGHAPWKGDWNLPAGYVEFNETPEHAAIREAKEETGLDIAITQQVGTYTYEDDPRGNGLLVVFRAKAVGGALTANEETTRFGYFAPDVLPENICGAAHDTILADWREGRLG